MRYNTFTTEIYAPVLIEYNIKVLIRPFVLLVWYKHQESWRENGARVLEETSSWLVQIETQRERDIEVSGESCSEVDVE